MPSRTQMLVIPDRELRAKEPVHGLFVSPAPFVVSDEKARPEQH
jgi:hypothetical protein